MAILELQEKGQIQILYNKWWKNRGNCHHDDKNEQKVNIDRKTDTTIDRQTDRQTDIQTDGRQTDI